MKAFRLNIVVDIDQADSSKFLGVILKFMDCFEPSIKNVSVYEMMVKKSEVVDWLKKSKRDSFEIEFGDWSVRLACVRRASIFVFYIENARSSFDWDWWVRELHEAIPIKQAWVVNCDYDYWQNAQSLSDYEFAGKSSQGLPTKSNGLPFPLEEVIIDTSSNPGRWEFKMGYVEAVGSVMWLSNDLLQQLKSSIERIESIPWAQVLPFEEGIWRVQSSDQPFSEDQAEGVVRQDSLRSALYRFA